MVFIHDVKLVVALNLKLVFVLGFHNTYLRPGHELYQEEGKLSLVVWIAVLSLVSVNDFVEGDVLFEQLENAVLLCHLVHLCLCTDVMVEL